MQKITPCLWFDKNAEEAVNFYLSVFKSGKIDHVAYNGENGPGSPGSVLTILFEIEGQKFLALNGGPQFKFTHAISLMVNCKTQTELDEFWEKLSADGGSPSECGWLQDKFGLSWQIVPENIAELISDKDQKKAQATLQAVWSMKKLDIEAINKAYADAEAA